MARRIEAPPMRAGRPKLSGSARRAEARRRARRNRILQVAIPAMVVAVVAVVAIVLVASGGGGAPSDRVSVSGPARATLLPDGAGVPDYRAPGLAGGTVSWAEFRGDPTVLVVWAPWCPHCQVEMPMLGRIAPDYPGVGVATVVTAVGDRPGPSPEGFFAQHHLAFRTAVDDADGTIMQVLGVSGFPTVYFVDRDGRVLSSLVGEAPESDFRAGFAALQDGAAAA